MKKIIVMFIIMFIPVSVYSISASSYIVLDENSGNVLNGYNIHEDYLIASITKIITAIIVIENTSDLDKKITVGDEVLKAYGSAIYIEVGEELTIRDLLYGMMMRSGNDASIVLASEISGSMEEFVKLMNDLVKELDLKNTIFFNNHGLEDSNGENKSSTYDMAILTKYAMENDDFMKIFSTKNITVKSSYKTYSWSNKNKLLHNYEYITGGKTGYTEKAGRTLVSTASYNNMDLIIVTINDGNDWNDHITLYENIFNNYESIKVLDKDISSLKNDLYVKNDYYALVKNGEEDKLNIEYEIYKNPTDKIGGNVLVYYDDKLLYEDYLYIFEKEDEKSFWSKVLSWFKLW